MPETSVIVTLWPTARSPSAQRTVLPSRPQAGGATDTNVMPGGSGSATRTSLAVEGPLFVTTIVYVTLTPGGVVAGTTDLTIATSAIEADRHRSRRRGCWPCSSRRRRR